MNAPLKIGRLPMMRISLSYVFDLPTRANDLFRDETDDPLVADSVARKM